MTLATFLTIFWFQLEIVDSYPFKNEIIDKNLYP
jgi:hypothetical protein